MDTPILCCIICFDDESNANTLLAEHYWCKIRLPEDIKVVLVFNNPPNNMSSITLPVIITSKSNKVYSMIYSLDKCSKSIHPKSKHYMFMAPNTIMDTKGLLDYFSLCEIDLAAIGGIISETDMRVKYALGGTLWMTNNVARDLSKMHIDNNTYFAPYDIMLSQICYNFKPVIIDSPFIIVKSDEDIVTLDTCRSLVIIVGEPYVVESQVYSLLLQFV